MKALNYCRVMERIGKYPDEEVPLSLRQIFELKAHVKACHKCAAIAEAVNRMAPPRIGRKPEAS